MGIFGLYICDVCSLIDGEVRVVEEVVCLVLIVVECECFE